MGPNDQVIDFSKMDIDEIDKYRKMKKKERSEAEENERKLEAEKVSYIPINEVGTIPSKEYKDVPAAVRKYIERILGFVFILTAAVVAIFIFSAFNFYLLLGLLIVDIICLTSAVNAYIRGISDEIMTFDGIVYSCTEHGLKGVNKRFVITIYNEERDKFLSFNYHKRVSVGSPIILYLDSTAKITMGDNGPETNSFITVKFSQVLQNEINEALENGYETVKDFLE